MTQPPNTTNTPDSTQIAAEQDLDRLAYESLYGDLSALTTRTRLNLDLSQAATIAVQAALKITDDTRATFAQMPAIFFNPAHLANLEKHGRAARYVTRKLRQARVLGESDARLPADLVDACTSQYARMFRVADYALGDQETVARQLAAIRSGHGYQDLANDLDDLSDMFDATPKRWPATKFTTAPTTPNKPESWPAKLSNNSTSNAAPTSPTGPTNKAASGPCSPKATAKSNALPATSGPTTKTSPTISLPCASSPHPTTRPPHPPPNGGGPLPCGR